MTLCVTWKAAGKLHFASDSRITNGDKYSDNAIKILPLHVKVYGPRDSESGIAPTAFNKIYGMCYSGSSLGAHSLLDFLGIYLQRLQYVPTYVTISFDQICNIVFKFYNRLTKTLQKDLAYDHSIDFFLAGYCPQEKELKIAKYYFDDQAIAPQFMILDSSSKEFVQALGTGEESFGIIFESLTNIKLFNNRVLYSVKKTIDGRYVESVGGNIQYGSFDGSYDFYTTGILNRFYDDEGLLKKYTYCMAGIDMTGDEFEPKDSELFMMGTYLDPFNFKAS